MRYVLWGVSGCGKSSVGAALAQRCKFDFVDGDTLHPEKNIRKMASEIPLNDDDRAPWLADVGRALGGNSGPIVIGCSALKRKYRDWICNEASCAVHFLHLHARKDILSKRVAARTDHFMPPSLLDSQYATLEQLLPDELGSVIDITKPFDQVVAQSETYVMETLK